MNKILFFFFTAVTAVCTILTFSTAAQRRGQIPNYSYPPRLLDELKRLQQAALASDYALKQTAYLANNIGPRLSGSPQAQRAVEYVAEEMRKVGLEVKLEDASQSLGAYPLDIAKVQPDFLVSVGYKWLMGPYALGYLYAAPKWRESGKPIENSWLARAGSENFASLVDYRDEYRAGARRFDMGEFPNFVLAPMAVAALRQILEWKVENIQHTLAALTGLVAREAAKLGCASLPSSHRVNHMIGIRLPGGIPAGLGERLAEAKIFVSIRGDAVRIAPHLYNDESDIEKLFTFILMATPYLRSRTGCADAPESL
jgi:selenocysteine lyase/cysteine desulfurase